MVQECDSLTAVLSPAERVLLVGSILDSTTSSSREQRAASTAAADCPIGIVYLVRY